MIGPQIPTGLTPTSGPSTSGANASTEGEGDDGGVVSMAVQNKAAAFVTRGMNKAIAIHLAEILVDDRCMLTGVSELLESNIRVLPQRFGEFIVNQMRHINYVGVVNTSVYLVSVIGLWRDRVRSVGDLQAMSGPLVGHPSADATRELCRRTGFPMDVTASERKFGPPPGWPAVVQRPIVEVRVSDIPPDTYEDVLVPFFEKYGRLYEVRVLLDVTTGRSSGFAHVTYTQQDYAKSACVEMLGENIKGQMINVSITSANCRLYVGNIPKIKTREELMLEMERINLTDVVNIVCFPDATEPRYFNRGFFFADFKDHESAVAAKRQLDQQGVTVFNSFKLYVDWAEGFEDTDPTEEALVKIAFVRNLTQVITEQYLRGVYKAFGPIEKIIRLNNYAFVHFVERADALKAIEGTHGTQHLDTKFDVRLARPLTTGNKNRINAWRIKTGGKGYTGSQQHSGYGVHDMLQWQQEQHARMVEQGGAHPASFANNAAYEEHAPFGAKSSQNQRRQWQEMHPNSKDVAAPAPPLHQTSFYGRQHTPGVSSYSMYGSYMKSPRPSHPPSTARGGGRHAAGPEGGAPSTKKPR